MKAYVIILLALSLALPAAALPLAPAGIPVEAREAAQARDVFDIGIPAGNAYNPSSLALDPARNVAYVYHATSDNDRAAIAVVDLAAQKVTRLLRLGKGPLGGASRLLLTPDRGQLLLWESAGLTLWVVDPQGGALRELLDHTRDVALSEDGALLFAARQTRLEAHALTDLLAGRTAPRWQSPASYDRLALNGGRLLAASFRSGAMLALIDTRTGTSLARCKGPDSLNAIGRGSGSGWAAVVSGENPRLIRYDAALKQAGETRIPYANDFTYDAGRDRFLLSGARYEGTGSNARARTVALAVSGADGAIAQETPLPGVNHAVTFSPWADGLLALPIGGPAKLSLLAADAFAPQGEIPMGARVDEAVVDADKMLYVADDLSRIHALELPGGKEVALWQGGAPLALDAANGRLYANRGERVVALSLRDGSVQAEFGQGGDPAPDPKRDLVYIADRGITMHDRSGKRLGELASTFPDPQGFSPNPHAYAAEVNPVTGHVAATFYNGIPGSNGGSFLRIYESGRDKFVAPPAPHSFVMDVLADSKGQWRVAYSPARNQEAVQTLSPEGKELRRLDHRTGFLALDERSDDLYLFTEGRVTRLAASTLTALEALQGPDTVGGLAAGSTGSAAYLTNRAGPRVQVVRLADLAPLDLKPAAAAIRPDAQGWGLEVTASGKQRTLIGYFDNAYRSSDGATWQRLLPGLDLQYAKVTAVAGGTIFLTGRTAYGGEGVWRSRDSGETWEWLTGGLTDLLAFGPVLARSADDAYVFSRGQGLLRWDAAARRWQLVAAPEQGKEWTSFSLAPDGVLFRNGGGYLERSGDGGKTWATLAPAAQTGEIIGFSALYTVTKTIYSFINAPYSLSQAVQRSTDNGKTWTPSLTSAQVPLDGYPLQMVTGFGRTYLLTRPYPDDGKRALLRTTDYGDTWQVAPPDAAGDAEYFAVDPLDGRLWFQTRNGARPVNPDALRWTPVKAAPQTRAIPTRTPAPTPAPTATVGPCATPLAGGEADINMRSLGLGCPRGPSETVQMARQRFPGGQMIWRADRRWIYVLYNDGTWGSFIDRWTEGDPPDDPALIPPADFPHFQQPVRGFGKVWREELGGASGKLGWALAPEQGVEGQAQDWDYGTVLRFGGEVLILQSIGTWRQ